MVEKRLHARVTHNLSLFFLHQTTQPKKSGQDRNWLLIRFEQQNDGNKAFKIFKTCYKWVRELAKSVLLFIETFLFDSYKLWLSADNEVKRLLLLLLLEKCNRKLRTIGISRIPDCNSLSVHCYSIQSQRSSDRWSSFASWNICIFSCSPKSSLVR